MKSINIPKDVKYILNKLKNHGFEAFLVGGSIRDFLLGLEPKDFDIATCAKPEQVIQVFSEEKIFETGIKHGTVTININHENYEVTTYRVDGEYEDYRRPNSVAYTNKITEDLARRDFTINAIAYSESLGLVDPFNGREDLERGIIKCVGNPNKRFNEDPLRIMRGLRQASILGFEIDDLTSKSMMENCHLLAKISKERIREEFVKLLLGKTVRFICTEYKDVLAVVIPEITPMFGLDQKNPYHTYHVYEHTLRVVENIAPQKELRLAAFFHDIGKPHTMSISADGRGHFYGHEAKGYEITSKIMRRLKFDNKTKKAVTTVVDRHKIVFSPNSRQVGRLLSNMGYDNLIRLIALEEADVKGQNPKVWGPRLENIENFKKRLEAYIEEDKCFAMRDLAINGRDLMDIGYSQGREIGVLLKDVYHKVVDGKLENSKEELIKYVQIKK